MPSQYQDKQSRYATLPGYPKEEIFKTPEQLSDYFSREKIVCLRCGKTYRTLGIHLKTIHEMEPNEYREIYGIPWTYGLSCTETKKLNSDNAKEYIKKGIFKPSAEQAKLARGFLKKQRNRQPVREEITKRSLAIMNHGKSGDEAVRRRKAPKIGSEEHRKNLQNRPGLKEKGIAMGKAWKGKKQSPEHIKNRMKAIHGEDWEPTV